MIKKETFFSSDEKKHFLWTVLAIGFMLSFTRWGTETFDLAAGLRNFVFAVLIVALSLLIKLIVQKSVARKSGIRAEFSSWIPGLILGLIVSFLTNGILIFLAVGTVSFSVIEHLRIGHKFREVTQKEMAWFSAVGPVTSIILAVIFKLLGSLTAISSIMNDAIMTNIWLAVFAILPIPLFMPQRGKRWWESIAASEGLNMLYGTRIGYVAVLALVLTSAVSIAVMPLLQALLTSVISTLIIIILYYAVFERE